MESLRPFAGTGAKEMTMANGLERETTIVELRKLTSTYCLNVLNWHEDLMWASMASEGGGGIIGE